MNRPDSILERFLSPVDRAKATHELVSLGKSALPVLTSLFDGSAKNKFGVPYRSIGAIDGGYVAMGMLGIKAKSLEIYVRQGIRERHAAAIDAAGRLLHIEEATAVALAEVLNQPPYGNVDAAQALIRCGEHRSPAVLKTLGNNSNALHWLESQAQRSPFNDP